MRHEVARDLSASAGDFVNVVWPAIRSKCGGGKLLPVESVSSDVGKATLDQAAGIDSWQIFNDPASMRGIASRIQWTDRSWDTFTIRMSRRTGAVTEFEKRMLAINSHRGYLYPYLTVQAYLQDHGGPLLSAAVVQTESLFCFAYENIDSLKKGRAPDGNEFLIVPWKVFKDAGHDIKVISQIPQLIS